MSLFRSGRGKNGDKPVPAEDKIEKTEDPGENEDSFLPDDPILPDPAEDLTGEPDGAEDPESPDEPEETTDPDDPEDEEDQEDTDEPDEESFDFETEFGFEGDDSDEDFESGVFINSLDELDEDDIPLSETARQAERVSPFEIARRFMFWIFLAAFLVSSFLLVQNLIQKQQAAKIYRDIQAEFFSTGFSFDVSEAFRTDRSQTPGLEEDREQRTIRTMTELLDGAENDAMPEDESSGGTRVVNEDLERKRAFLQNMIRKNADVYGYIIVPNTGISYPVVLGKDNDYYLNHAVTGEYNPVGCIFADYECDHSITKNYNTVFYGHNIENTSVGMFHDVTLFFQKEYFENTYIYVYTMDGLYIYEPFAVYETNYEDQYFRVTFSSSEEFVAFAEDIQKLSAAKDPETHDRLSKNFIFSPKDRILTLSTCTNGQYTQRYALHAKLIRTILE